MYDQNGKIVDRREMLRVKLKTLAAESRFIRKEELRLISAGRRGGGCDALRTELYEHRLMLRNVARDTLAAYAIIRGREHNLSVNPDKVAAMVKKYGPKVVVPRVPEPAAGVPQAITA